ncbi:MAG TPA: CRISPR-associated protein Cas4 [Candidatus Nanoarchaeia archaeon]|nr:CRISPR-associated protein Cas4 [Candidatus Nanoarchaeia archaeon]
MIKIPVTWLSSYLYCSRKLFLEQVLNLKEPPKESLILGSIRHEAYDKINKNEESIVKSIGKSHSDEQIKKDYKDSCAGILNKIIENKKRGLEMIGLSSEKALVRNESYILAEAETRASNVIKFIEKNKVFGDELWQTLTPKILSEIRVESDELKLKGIIDQIHVYEDSYVPFELKTGSMPKDGVWPSHRIQVAAYSLLLGEKFNTDINEAFVHYLDSNEKRQIVINPFMKYEITSMVDEIIELIQSKDLPDYCDSENKCRSCGLRKTCYDNTEMEKLMKVKIN